jgi:DNA-dependent RNA polymerase
LEWPQLIAHWGESRGLFAKEAMMINFDPGVYARLSPEVRLYVLGLLPREPIRSFEDLGRLLKPGLMEGKQLDEVAATKRRSDKAHARPFTATPTGRALFARFDILPKLAAYIAGPEAQDACPRHLRRLIRLVEHETLALVAVDALINTIVAGWDWHDESCGMKVAKSVGESLRDEIEMARLRDPDSIDYRRVMQAQNRHIALSRYRTLKWSETVLVRAGWWLLNCAETCTLFEMEERQVGRNKLTLPKIADGYWEEIKKIREELSLARPYYFPHDKPPPDWTSFRTEYGPDRMPATFVRDEHPDTVAAVNAAFESGQLDRHAKGVSNVQRVPWMINEFMIPVVEELACHVEKRFRTLEGADDIERFKTALRDDIGLARDLVGRPFWTPYNIDFRGRLNPLAHFNIAREDRVRCLFQFWNGQPIGDSVQWLEIAVANAAGEAKGTWRKRHDWVSDNHDLIRRVAEDPFETVDDWKDFSDPFQFVAACHELIAAENEPNFITHLPVFLDGTANGIQHLACMTRDEESGKLVNLSDPDERYDIYGVMWARAKTKLRAAGDEHAEWWLSPRGNCDRLFRGLFKRPTMTYSYGVTEGGIRDQIVEAYKEEFGKPEPELWQHVDYLAKMTMATTKEMLRRPEAVMEFTRGLAELQAWRNLPLKWITPTGLPVSSNRCYEPNTKTVELKLPRRRVEYRVAEGRKDKIILGAARNDAPANFVHSMDAAHLVLSVNAAVDDGITDVAVVHDCYGAAAPQVQRFQQIIRIQMALMYRCFDVLGALLAGCQPLIGHTLPEKGTLDLLEIQHAEYPFT